MAVLDFIGPQSKTFTSGKNLSWQYISGEVQTIIYEGDRTSVENLYNSYKQVAGFSPDYDDLQYTNKGGRASLTIKLCADGAPIYEMPSNEVSAHISTHPYFDSLTDDNVAEVLKAVDKKNGTGLTGKKKDLFARLIRGIEEYTTSQYVLRETKIVSKRSSVTASWENVNMVDTPPATSAANTLLGNVPTGEWIKKQPDIRQVGSRRWQIVTEWWWTKKADAILYGGTYLPEN